MYLSVCVRMHTHAQVCASACRGQILWSFFLSSVKTEWLGENLGKSPWKSSICLNPPIQDTENKPKEYNKFYLLKKKILLNLRKNSLGHASLELVPSCLHGQHETRLFRQTTGIRSSSEDGAAFIWNRWGGEVIHTWRLTRAAPQWEQLGNVSMELIRGCRVVVIKWQTGKSARHETASSNQ